MDIILATRNPSKAEQVSAVFSGTGIRIITQEETGIQGEAVEDGATLEENATKKALYARRGQVWSMADDTGIFIHALGDEPGIQAAYWGGESLTTDERMRYCLCQLEGINDRRATMRTCVVLISPSGQQHVFRGEATGRIRTESACEPRPKMPYSAIFVPDEGDGRTWAEMSIEEENRISHRGKAFRQVADFLNQMC